MVVISAPRRRPAAGVLEGSAGVTRGMIGGGAHMRVTFGAAVSAVG